jgi:hypothetical protein
MEFYSFYCVYYVYYLQFYTLFPAFEADGIQEVGGLIPFGFTKCLKLKVFMVSFLFFPIHCFSNLEFLRNTTAFNRKRYNYAQRRRFFLYSFGMFFGARYRQNSRPRTLILDWEYGIVFLTVIICTLRNILGVSKGVRYACVKPFGKIVVPSFSRYFENRQLFYGVSNA